MPPNRRMPSALALAVFVAAFVAAACGGEPAPTPVPSVDPAASGATAIPTGSERPFTEGAWPAAGSACDVPGYGGRLGRIETVSARTIRFTLCAPDGAFPARLAHPALGVIDSTAVDIVTADPLAARLVPGSGTFLVEAWAAGENARLGRVMNGSAPLATAAVASPSPTGSPGPGTPPPTIILRWAGSSADRTAAIREAEVDGIDAPNAADLEAMSTVPELVVIPRPGLETAYLGFGTGHGFGQLAVRRAFAQGLDQAALAGAAFPAGSTPATHVAPCDVAGGCAGMDWYEFNGPGGAAALDLAGYDRRQPIPLQFPDAPVPGLPDPAAVAAAVANQLRDSLGVKVEVVATPARELEAAIAAEDVDGLYLGGVASQLADASGFLEPLFGTGSTGTAAARARGVRRALGEAASITEAGARLEAFQAINDRVRSTAPLIPLVHPGSMAAYRADVTGVAISPLGVDPLGAFVPGDRGQLVVMDAVEPAGAWCGVAGTGDALRLCGLVTPGLLAFAGASLDPAPSLASRCDPSEGATVWTCRLRSGLEFTDGKRVDTGDVLASLRAQGDAGSALRAKLLPDAFRAWDDLFGGPVPEVTAP